MSLKFYFSAILAIVACLGYPSPSLLRAQTTPVLRGALLPQTQEDTGDAYNEMAHLRNANQYFVDRTTSGDIKDWREAIQTEYQSFLGMRSAISYKAEVTPAWVQIAGSISGHASGRARGIAFDPKNPATAYLVTASGGMYKTTNATAASPTWVSISDANFNSNWGGAIAIDPNDSNIVYAGTGEVYGHWSPESSNTTTPFGTGVYKSTDGGMNWTNVMNGSVEGGSCGKIAICPVNSQRVYVATGNTTGGLLISTNGGSTWTKATSAGADPVSVIIDPQNPARVHVGLQSGGVYNSVDSGATWAKSGAINGGHGSVSTTILALAPSSPNIIYASISNGSAQQGSTTYGVAASNDYGATWQVVNSPSDVTDKSWEASPGDNYPNPNYLSFQGDYDNAIVVNPSAPNEIFVGGIQIWESTDGGSTLHCVSFSFQGLSSSQYAHADCHDLEYNGNVLWACTDGGVCNTTDGSTWNTMPNLSLSTLQFVGVDASPNFSYVLGGTQDNAVERCWPLSASKFDLVRGGDGGFVWISPQDPSLAFSTYVYADFEESNDSGNSNNGQWNTSTPTGSTNYIYNSTTHTGNAALANENAPFYPPYDASPDGNTIVFGGNSHIWISENGGQDEFENESKTSGIRANTIYCYPNDNEQAWAGSYGGSVWSCSAVADGPNSVWTASKALGGGPVSGITANPNDETNVFAVVAGVSSGTGSTNKHFYVSHDQGATWTSPATNFPNLSCNCITISPANNMLFVGTDAGVVYSANAGVTWSTLPQGMPLVQVTSLKVRGNNSQYLLAGTYGRGMFYMDISNLSGVSVGETAPLVASLDQSFPNPVSRSSTEGATIGFSLAKTEVVRMTLHDLLGREIAVLANGGFDSGHHTATLHTSGLASGTYICALTTSGVTVTKKVTVEN